MNIKMNNHTQRLNRIISSAGLTSRRKADEWIKAGRVMVNDHIVTELGTQAVWGVDRILVDGKALKNADPRIYIILNKPFGYVCTLKDPEGRPIVTDLIKEISDRVYPVGRLDFDSLGLLMLTNDGDLSYRLTHPRYQVPRTYKITVSGKVVDEAVNALVKGVNLEDGPSGPSKTSIISKNEKQTNLKMTINMGRTRQVRRMFEALGYEVVHLIRTDFGNLKLGDLKIGEYRYLETVEVKSLKKLVGLK